MLILGKYYLTVFPLHVAKENWDFGGVCIVVWGVRWGTPWPQVVDIVPGHCRGGLRFLKILYANINKVLLDCIPVECG